MSTQASRLYDFEEDRDAGIKIMSARVDGELDNIMTKLNQKVLITSTAPTNPIDGQTWVDVSQNPPRVKLWDDTNSRWIIVNGFYRRTSAGWDWTVSNFTIDGAWHELDLTAKAGNTIKGASAVLFIYSITGDAGDDIKFDKDGEAFSQGWVHLNTSGAVHRGQFIVTADTDGKIQYNIESSVTDINLAIRGWWY